MNKYVIHPDLTDNLSRFFDHTCVLQSPTYPSDGETEPSGYSDAFTGVECAVAEWNPTRDGKEVKRKDMTPVISPFRIILKGKYAINENYRIVVDGSDTYDILDVGYDSKDKITRLTCEMVE